MSGTRRSGISGEEVRAKLYDLADDESLPFAEKRRRILELGREFLGADNAHVERVDAATATHEVVASVGDTDVAPVGASFERAKTYCRRTVESDGPLAVSDADAQGWADDPARVERGVACYLGATITVEGVTYGTVCFLSADPRGETFDADERAFAELVARTLGREIESRRHRRELERTERKYESLVEAAPDAIFLVDTDTAAVVEANAAATELTGLSREELLGRDPGSLQPDGQLEAARRRFRSFVQEGGGTWSRLEDGTPVRIERADGSTVPVELSVSVTELDGDTYLQAVVRDVSERLERQRELRVRERAIEEAPVGITLADARKPDTPLTYANPEFERLTGHDRSTAVGTNCRFLQGERTDDEAVGEIRDAIEAERPVRTELLNYRADGTPFWNELTVAPLEDAAGETTHFLGFQRDVTDRKRREQMLQVLNRVLRHNLRNRLTVLGGLAGAIARRPAEASVADRAETIVEEVDDLARLSDRARSVEEAVRSGADPVERDAVAVLEAVAADLRERHPDVEVTVSAPERQPVLATEFLADAVAEVASNAAKYGDGMVRLAVEPPEGDSRVAIRVEDDGPGLPEQERAVLRQGDETPLEHGSGLGLWMVNWVVTEAGGRVETDVGDGTTVTLRLCAPSDENRGRKLSSAFGG